MLRTTVDKAYIKRPIRPLYAVTQATPKEIGLDPNVAIPVDVFPGMAMTQTGNDTATLAVADADVPMGLSALYIGGDGIDEVADSGVGRTAVWVLGPDAEFEILGEALAGDWSGASVDDLVYFAGDGSTDDRGKLVPSGYTNRSTAAVGRVVALNGVSPNISIVLGGLRGTV